MATRLSLPTALSASRTTVLSASHSKSSCLLGRLNIQVRHTSYIERPRRPYTFTQLVMLSDGSAYTMRTTSPAALYRASKDTRNSLLWQPSEKSLRNMELDEAGKLAAFRERYGSSFDAGPQSMEAEDGDAPKSHAADMVDFADLITGFVPQDSDSMTNSGPKKSPTKRK